MSACMRETWKSTPFQRPERQTSVTKWKEGGKTSSSISSSWPWLNRHQRESENRLKTFQTKDTFLYRLVCVCLLIQHLPRSGIKKLFCQRAEFVFDDDVGRFTRRYLRLTMSESGAE